MDVRIERLKAERIEEIATAFAKLGWNKPASQYERYLEEQDSGLRVVLVATLEGVFAGYVTVVWETEYEPFRAGRIPEIVDFNVLPHFRRKGIGTMLMAAAEKLIGERSAIAGIGVGMDSDYGAVQILYAKRGYLPDGHGLHYDNRKLKYGDVVSVDDSLCLHFTKKTFREPQ